MLTLSKTKTNRRSNMTPEILKNINHYASKSLEYSNINDLFGIVDPLEQVVEVCVIIFAMKKAKVKIDGDRSGLINVKNSFFQRMKDIEHGLDDDARLSDYPSVYVKKLIGKSIEERFKTRKDLKHFVKSIHKSEDGCYYFA